MEVASDEPPMTLEQRMKLSRLQLKLQIPSIDEIFTVQGDRVASEKVRDFRRADTSITKFTRQSSIS